MFRILPLIIKRSESLHFRKSLGKRLWHRNLDSILLVYITVPFRSTHMLKIFIWLWQCSLKQQIRIYITPNFVMLSSNVSLKAYIYLESDMFSASILITTLKSSELHSDNQHIIFYRKFCFPICRNYFINSACFIL